MCPHCESDNIIGPFEMDGYADGKYQAKGLHWICCRDCGRTSRVNDPLANEPGPGPTWETTAEGREMQRKVS